ncbi:hypothetical protein [Bradyrhizobium sp. WU425]|uniref:hypothetical protein n=1 Tax=Bradyrhizobium sp. WU425 TaxID=187029 RepID=UPI001E49F4AD|nr:hypothetical protein [Bradyrhizobium canariense]UFW72881.1 hypothetical protein BcanWU425_03675 [Bradyrhizobium canariense]
MRKLPPTAANVAFVANQLAGSGARRLVSLADIRGLIEGTAEEISDLRDLWIDRRDDGAPTASPANSRGQIVEDLQAQIAALRAAAAAGRSSRSEDPPQRNADADELDAVMRAGRSDAEPDRPKSFIRDVWEARTLAGHGSHTLPEGVARSTERNLAAKLAAEAKGELVTPEPKTRRVAARDWKGARNEFLARHVATVLRRAGRPMNATDINRAVAERDGPTLLKPGLALGPQLVGGRIVPIGKRGLYWFEGENPPMPLRRYQRSDSPRALSRISGAKLFDRIVEILRAAAPRAIAFAELKKLLGREIEDMHPEWLSERLSDSVNSGRLGIRRMKGGFAWFGPGPERA